MRASADRRSGQDDQFGDLAAVQGQFKHADIVDHLTDTGCAGLDQRSIGLHLNSVCDLADLQADVDNRITADLQDDAGLGELAEPGQARFQPVWSHRQIWQNV